MRELEAEPRWDLPLRLLGGLHYLALERGLDPWSDVRATIGDHREWLARFVAEQQVQTNEVQRCWALLPAFLSLGAREVDLIELGPSAGLNLLWDRYRYRYGHEQWGPPDALLELGGEVRRALPAGLLEARPVVRTRRGIDLSPVDATTDDGARLLECFVWADQAERLERLRRAIETLRLEPAPPELIRGDYATLLPGLLDGREQGVLTAVFQTASLGYLSQEQHERVEAALEAAGARGPLAFVSAPSGPWVEGGFGLGVRIWPADERRVAIMDYHGAWLEWLP